MARAGVFRRGRAPAPKLTGLWAVDRLVHTVSPFDDMGVFVLVLVPVGFLALSGIFLSLVYRSKLMLAGEVGRTPILTETMGGRIGRIRYTAPFVRFALYDDVIVISAFRQFALTLADIDAVDFVKDRRSGSFFRSVRILHHAPECPADLFLYSSSGQELAETIAAALHGRST